MLLIDLDRFKEINDTLGHQSGDSLLEQVARTLSAAVRESDTVARLGGDEFADRRAADDAEGALPLAAKLREALAGPSTVAGIELEIDASVGIAIFPEHGADADTLLRRADVALYLSKDAHAPCLYLAGAGSLLTGAARAGLGPAARARERRRARRLLPAAGRPAHGHIVRAEALVRWQHPTRGLLRTGRLPAARRAHRPDAPADQKRPRGGPCDSAATGGRPGSTCRSRSTSADATCSTSRCRTRSRKALARLGVPADRLELEITENTILTDPPRARAVLARLSELGVSLAIDDFGAGYSSLGYLKRLPVDVLKIDRSFVMNMSTDENDAVIVRSTIDLGHNLGLRVVAEGVEDESGDADARRARLRHRPGLLTSAARCRPAELLERTRRLGPPARHIARPARAAAR